MGFGIIVIELRANSQQPSMGCGIYFRRFSHFSL